MEKTQRAFFHFGSIGAFQGDISPLSSREITETCVMPVLLCGSENCILTEALLKSLESFQGELVNRVLKWPKNHSNTAAVTALDVPTMKDCLSGSVVLALCGDVDYLCLVRECKELEEIFGTCFTEMITNKEDAA